MDKGFDGSFSTQLLRCYYSESLKRFKFPQDCYNHWVLLAADEGEFQFMLSDEALKAEEMKWESVRKGELVLCPPGMTLYRRSTAALAFHFVEFIWEGKEGLPYLEGDQMPHGKITIHNAGRLASTLQLIRACDSTTEVPGTMFYRTHLLNDILHLCLTEAYKSKFGSAIKDEAIQHAVQYIRSHAGGEVSMGRLAAEVGLSQSQFTRRFQASLGLSPMVYLTRIRMHMAKTLLLETEQTLDQIAENCGYQNGFYFSRVFSRQTGENPSKYRRVHRF